MSEAGEGMAVSDAEGAPTPVPDARLLESHELARTALLSITSAQSIGDVAGYTVEGEPVTAAVASVPALASVTKPSVSPATRPRVVNSAPLRLTVSP